MYDDDDDDRTELRAERRSGRLDRRICRRHGSTKWAEPAKQVQWACPRGRHSATDQSRAATAGAGELAALSLVQPPAISSQLSSFGPFTKLWNI